MTTEVKVPTLPESVADALIAGWHKQVGDSVARGEVLVDIETDKVVLEVPATTDGVLQEIRAAEGATVTANAVIGIIAEGAAATKTPATTAPAANTTANSKTDTTSDAAQGPAVRKLIAEHGLDSSQISGSGKGGRIIKEDVINHLAAQQASKPATNNTPAVVEPAATDMVASDARHEKRVPMTRLRARIAERLLEAKQSTAMLTTFNEVNMQPLMNLRKQYKDVFEKQHGIKLGFMSMFVKASTEALKRFPDVNASIDGSDIVYHGFCDVGVAVSSDRGLVVPILRNAESMSLAAIESAIAHFGSKARDGKLSLEDMTGGTFTISNGGVFGSLLSTPILNPPQSAILGMHSIQERPVAENGQVVIRPMMYIALSYDHRIIDGKGAVSFLKTIKELVEDPHRILLDV